MLKIIASLIVLVSLVIAVPASACPALPADAASFSGAQAETVIYTASAAGWLSDVQIVNGDADIPASADAYGCWWITWHHAAYDESSWFCNDVVSDGGLGDVLACEVMSGGADWMDAGDYVSVRADYNAALFGSWAAVVVP